MGEHDLHHLHGEVQRVLAHLHKAHEFALDVQLDIWQFAEPLQNLVEMGAMEPALRWLVLKGYAEHAQELTTFRETDRRFRPSMNVSFAPRTCFVLTAAGADLAANLLDEPPPPNGYIACENITYQPAPSLGLG